MINDDKKNRKIFIKETLGSRKYFSYRSDMIFFKILLCVVVFFTVYIAALDIVLAMLVTIQVFLIFTLINRLSIERREKEGKELYTEKAKKDYFKTKLNELKTDKFEDFVKLFANKEGYRNYKKVGKHMFSAVKENETYLIKVFKLYELSEVDIFDIRAIPTYMNQNNINKCFLVTLNSLTEEANKFLDKINETKDIKIINENILFELAEKYNLLPEESFFIGKIIESKKKAEKKYSVRKNAFSTKKIIIYSLAGVIFNFLSGFMPYNAAARYISYYFIVLAFISAAYCIYFKIYRSAGKIAE